MNIKTVFFLLDQQISKNCIKQNVSEDVGRLEFSYTVGVNVNWLTIFGNHLQSKLKMHILFPSNFNSENSFYRYNHACVQRSITTVIKVCFEIIKAESLMFINKKIVKLIVI